MATLRVLLDAAPETGRADAWALFDANERILQSGHGMPGTWPEADRSEAVLAASCVRIVSLKLPPMPADRVPAAAAYALEDQLAGPAEEQHIAASSQRPDGTVEAIVANRGLVAELAANFERVLAEPALAPRPPPGHWRAYASGLSGGFVRRPDGSAFAMSEHPGMPPELTLALDHAAGTGSAPLDVEMAFPEDKVAQVGVAQRSGTPLVRIDAWAWDRAGAAAFANATDMRQGEFARTTPIVAHRSARVFRIAATVAALAVALHIAASFGEWAFVRVEDWRARSALDSLAREMGIPGGTDASMEIARRHAEARHRAGLAAPRDALPLLARAAPALAALPAGTLKSATYADGHWTFDLDKPDTSLAAGLERQLTAAGLTSLQAANASGTRIRVSLIAGVQ
jgi:hypothetical protein